MSAQSKNTRKKLRIKVEKAGIWLIPMKRRGLRVTNQNMVSGASQADASVLVIYARKFDFETGYERGGQTREHVQLANTLGVSKLLVVVNKMDDPTVNWSKESALPDFHVSAYIQLVTCDISVHLILVFFSMYDEIELKLTHF
ncbi:eukaryotic peptide chain release factor GTP-binding subunit-like [Actinidia eriantha]|uniref:eukaryotic peptide chain release factor GTP-binding subunit-like n=1 Tax=Actinidia eriantha TaxID=165200 RepID=UPI0025866981|nr:eukaryotic peptide chain release factor GTP-binding subunit-like [Actinidia eriantha]